MQKTGQKYFHEKKCVKIGQQAKIWLPMDGCTQFLGQFAEDLVLEPEYPDLH